VLATGFLHLMIIQDFWFRKLVASATLGQNCPVLSTLGPRFRAAVTSVVNHVKTALREATRPLPLVAGFAMDLTRSRKELLAENALLRQQLIVASRKVKRPAFRPHERGLVVLLSRLARRWRDAVLLVKPDTILRWHRQGFRLFWRWKSRKPSKPRPRLSADVVALIRDMASSNRLWGAERIRGELLTLGIRVAKRTIQKYMRAVRSPSPPRGQSWHTFLRNHTVWACDFLQTYDIWFRPIFAFFIIDVNAKKVIHVGVTRGPSEKWTAQQLRNATPFGRGSQFIIRDRDDKSGASFDRAAKGAGIRVIRTAVKAPLMNSTCERFVGSARRECLDHMILLGERHMKSVLDEYCLRYFNTARPHQGLGQRVPVPAPRRTCSNVCKVIAMPVLGGLHHDYAAAAWRGRMTWVARTAACDPRSVSRTEEATAHEWQAGCAARAWRSAARLSPGGVDDAIHRFVGGAPGPGRRADAADGQVSARCRR
jgi:putative transposase